MDCRVKPGNDAERPSVGSKRDYSGLDIENWNIAMNTNVDPRAAAAKSNAPKQDLRAWLAQMGRPARSAHRGADREREIGGIVDIYQRKIGNPLVLFDEIPGYPKRLPHARQHAHLDPPHQHDAGQCRPTPPRSISFAIGAGT